MPSPYSLRSRQGRDPVNYAENDSQESEEDSDGESRQSPRQSQSHNTSGRSQSGNSRLDTTASDSFSFHSGHSPGVKTGSERGGLYPKLPASPGSPTARRRNIPREESPEHLRHSRLKRAPSPNSSKPQKESLIEKQGSQSLLHNPVPLIAILLIFLLLGFLLLNKEKPPVQAEEPQDVVPSFNQFSKIVDELKNKFPGQEPRLWRMVKSCAKHVFEPGEAIYPAILLLVSERKNNLLTASIAQAISQAFGSAMLMQPVTAEEISINLTMTKGMDMPQQKLHLDSWLKDKLKDNSAVVINHLESLHPRAALLLHGYCDGDNAPYKEVMLILGLYLEKAVDNQDAAEAALKKMWMSELSEDKVAALLSRVANNIALVKGSSQ